MIKRTVTLLLVLLAVAAVVPTAATAHHGEAPSSSPPQLASLQQEADNSSAAEPTTVERQVDEDVRVTAYRYDLDEETMSITIENTGTADAYVTMTEAIGKQQARQGDGTFGIETLRLREGETVTAQISVSRDGLRAVMVTTDRSVEQGRGTFLAADSGGSLYSGEPTWMDVRVAVVSMIVIVAIVLAISIWHKLSSKHKPFATIEVGR